MADLYFDEEPERQLTRLETDANLETVFRAVDEKLDLLEADPSSSAVRPRRFTNGLWCVIAYNADEDRVIMWEPHPERPDDVAVRYLGPATFHGPCAPHPRVGRTATPAPELSPARSRARRSAG